MTRQRALRLAREWAQGHKCTLRDGEAAEYHSMFAAILEESMSNDPLTLDQLREMDGRPVWVQTPGIEKYGRWVIVAGVNIEDKALYCKGDYTCRDYGKTWLAYAYPFFNINRDVWGECAYCGGIPHMEGVELKPCASGNIGCDVTFGKCRDDNAVGMVVYYRNAAAGYVDFDFCPFCGKPQTQKAWAELEKRFRGEKR